MQYSRFPLFFSEEQFIFFRAFQPATKCFRRETGTSLPTKFFALNYGSTTGSTFLEQFETTLFLNLCIDFAVEVLQQ